jgi:hypothetical protein
MADIRNFGADYPDVAVSGSETVAPAAGTVLVDSAAVPAAGHYRWRVTAGTDDTAQNILQIAHRNAANNADVELADFTIPYMGSPYIEVTFNMAASERVVVRNKNVGTAAKTMQASIRGWLQP